MKRACALTLLLGACAGVPAGSEDHPLAWMSGCWQTADGDYREVWSAPDHGYLFGYALSLEDGAVSFFEQSRIDPGRPGTFNAYPAGKGPAPFAEVARDAASITFADPDHDYPQRIRYARTGARMTATISLMDGSEEQDFAFRPCGG